MMQEMYNWYMDNLFPEHRRQAIRHAEKDGRDRRKRIAKGGAGQARAPVPKEVWMDPDWAYERMFSAYDRSSYQGRSKWERIGSPFVASVVDWGFIIHPATPAMMKWKAISRQSDRFHGYFD